MDHLISHLIRHVIKSIINNPGGEWCVRSSHHRCWGRWPRLQQPGRNPVGADGLWIRPTRTQREIVCCRYARRSFGMWGLNLHQCDNDGVQHRWVCDCREWYPVTPQTMSEPCVVLLHILSLSPLDTAACRVLQLLFCLCLSRIHIWWRARRRRNFSILNPNKAFTLL